ncbi:DUF4262 domain-containing protein [Sphingomonas sp. 3-13AW]|uniref:DUF4262 domain-containing protein n=1 Tax=Sphingomonas sp. 3-13AW TaxID=3050450 RepID=UPI003BB72C0E
MDETSRLRIVAKAAAQLAHANPDVSDDTIAFAVVAVVREAMSANEPDSDFSAETLLAAASQGIQVVGVSEQVLALISFQIDGRGEDIDLSLLTHLAALKLADEDTATLKEAFSSRFGEGVVVDFDAATTVADLVSQILRMVVANGDDQECCPDGVEQCSGNPGGYTERQDEAIRRHGVTLAPVLPDRDSPGFVYSIGMSEQGGTDLIFIGDCTPPTYNYLQMFIEIQLAGEQLPFGQFPADDVRNPFGVPIWLLPADEKLATHAFGSVSRLKRIGSTSPAKLAQVVMPDRSNRFPWEEGYAWLDQQVSRTSSLH